LGSNYPENDKSNLQQFLKDINVKNPSEICGKSATIKAYDKKQTIEGKEILRTYLKFKY
jgi:hypothetical protein